MILFQFKHVDIVCINKYIGWYDAIGEPYLIPLQLPGELVNTIFIVVIY